MGRDDAKPDMEKQNEEATETRRANRTALEKFFRLSISSSELITPRISQQDMSKIAKELEAKRAAREDESSSDEQQEEREDSKQKSRSTVNEILFKEVTRVSSYDGCQPTQHQLEAMSSCDFRDPHRSRKMSWQLNDAPLSPDSDLSASSTSGAFGQTSCPNDCDIRREAPKVPEVTYSKGDLQEEPDADKSQVLVCKAMMNEYTVPANDVIRDFHLPFERFEPLRERLIEIDDGELHSFLGRGRPAEYELVSHGNGGLSGVLNFVARMLAATVRMQALLPARQSAPVPRLTPPTPPLQPLVISNIQTIAQVCTPEATPFSSSAHKCPESLVSDLLATIGRKTEHTRVYMYTTPCQNPECKYEIPILPPRVADRANQPKYVSRKFINLCKLKCACRDGCLLHIINFLEETYGCELNHRDNSVRKSASSKVSFDQPAVSRSQESLCHSPCPNSQKLPPIDVCTSTLSITPKKSSPSDSPKQKRSMEWLSIEASCDKCRESKSKVRQTTQKPTLVKPIRKTCAEPLPCVTPPLKEKTSSTNCIDCRSSLQKMPPQQSLTMCSLKPTVSQIKFPQSNKSPSQTSCLALQPKCEPQIRLNLTCPAKPCQPCPGPQSSSRTLLKPPQIPLDLQAEMPMRPTGANTCPGSKTCLQKIECVEKVTDCTLVPGGECILEKQCVPQKTCTAKERSFLCDKLPCPRTTLTPDDLCRSRGTSTSFEALKQQQRGSPFICGMFGKMRWKLFGSCPPGPPGKKLRCRDKNLCSVEVGVSGRKTKWRALPLQPTKLLCSESSSCSLLDFKSARSFREKSIAPCHRSCKGVQVSKATCNASSATSALKPVSCADSGTNVMITSYDEAPPSHASQLCVRRMAPSKGPCGYNLPQVMGASCKEDYSSVADDECQCTSDEGLSDSDPVEIDPAASSRATFCLGSARESPPPRKKCELPSFTCEVDSTRFEPPPCVYITPSNENVAVTVKTDDMAVERARRCKAAAPLVRPAQIHTSVSTSVKMYEDDLRTIRTGQISRKDHKLHQLYRHEPPSKRELWIHDSPEETSSAFMSSNTDERDRVLSDVITTQLTVDEDGVMRMRKDPLPDTPDDSRRQSKGIIGAAAGGTRTPSFGTDVNVLLEADTTSAVNPKETANKENNLSGGTGDANIKNIVAAAPTEQAPQGQKVNLNKQNVSVETSKEPAEVILIAMPSSEQRKTLRDDKNNFETDKADYADGGMNDLLSKLCIGTSLRVQLEEQLKLRRHGESRKSDSFEIVDQDRNRCNCVHKCDLEGCRCVRKNECMEGRTYTRNIGAKKEKDETPAECYSHNNSKRSVHQDHFTKHQKVIIDGETSSHGDMIYLKQSFMRSDSKNRENETYRVLLNTDKSNRIHFNVSSSSEEYESEFERSVRYKMIKKPKDNSDANMASHTQFISDRSNCITERGVGKGVIKNTTLRKAEKRVDFEFEGKYKSNLKESLKCNKTIIISENVGSKHIRDNYLNKNDAGQTVNKQEIDTAYEKSNSDICDAKAVFKYQKAQDIDSPQVSVLAVGSKTKLSFKRRNKCDDDVGKVMSARGSLSNSKRCPVRDISDMDTVDEVHVNPGLIHLPHIGLDEKPCACGNKVYKTAICDGYHDRQNEGQREMSMTNETCQCASPDDDSTRGKQNMKDFCDSIVRKWKLKLPTNCPYSENFENLKEDIVYAILDGNGVPYKVIINISHNAEAKPETNTVGIQYEDLSLSDAKVASSGIGVQYVEQQNIIVNSESPNKDEYERAISKSPNKIKSFTQGVQYDLDLIKCDQMVVKTQDFTETENTIFTKNVKLLDTRGVQYEYDTDQLFTRKPEVGTQDYYNKFHVKPKKETLQYENIGMISKTTYKPHKNRQVQDRGFLINKIIKTVSNTQQKSNHMATATSSENELRISTIEQHANNVVNIINKSNPSAGVILCDHKTTDKTPSADIELILSSHDKYYQKPPHNDDSIEEKATTKQVPLSNIDVKTNIPKQNDTSKTNECICTDSSQNIQALLQSVKNVIMRPKFRKGLHCSKKIEIDRFTSNLATILDYSAHGVDLSDSESDISGELVKAGEVGSNKSVIQKTTSMNSVTRDGILYAQNTEEREDNILKKYKPLIKNSKQIVHKSRGSTHSLRYEVTDSNVKDAKIKEMVVRKDSNQNSQMQFERFIIKPSKVGSPAKDIKIRRQMQNERSMSKENNKQTEIKRQMQHEESASKLTIKKGLVMKESGILGNVIGKKSAFKISSPTKSFAKGSDTESDIQFGMSDRSKLSSIMGSMRHGSDHSRNDSKSEYEDINVMKPPSVHSKSKSWSTAIGQYERESSLLIPSSNPFAIQIEENEASDSDLSTEASITDSESLSDEKVQSIQDLTELEPKIEPITTRPTCHNRQDCKRNCQDPSVPKICPKLDKNRHKSSVESTPHIKSSKLEKIRHESIVRFKIQDEREGSHREKESSKYHDRCYDTTIPRPPSLKVQPMEPYTELYGKYRGHCEHKFRSRDKILSESNGYIPKEYKSKNREEIRLKHQKYLSCNHKQIRREKIILEPRFCRGPKIETCGTIFKAIQTRHKSCVCQKVNSSKYDIRHQKERTFARRSSSCGQQCVHCSYTWHVMKKDTFAKAHVDEREYILRAPSSSQLPGVFIKPRTPERHSSKKEVSRIEEISFMKPGFFKAKFNKETRQNRSLKGPRQTPSPSRGSEREAFEEAELTVMNLQHTCKSPTDNCSSDTSSYTSLSFEDSDGNVTFLKYFRKELRRRRVMTLNIRSFTVLAKRKRHQRRARRKAKRANLKIKSTADNSNKKITDILFKRSTRKKRMKSNTQISENNTRKSSRFFPSRKTQYLQVDKCKIKPRDQISKDILLGYDELYDNQLRDTDLKKHDEESAVMLRVHSSVIIKTKELPAATISFARRTSSKPGKKIVKTFRRLRFRKYCGIGRIAKAICTSIVAKEIHPPMIIDERPKTTLSKAVKPNNTDLTQRNNINSDFKSLSTLQVCTHSYDSRANRTNPKEQLGKAVSFEFNIKDGTECGQTNQNKHFEKTVVLKREFMRTDDIKELPKTRSSTGAFIQQENKHESKKKIFSRISFKNNCLDNIFHDNVIIKKREEKIEEFFPTISPNIVPEAHLNAHKIQKSTQPRPEYSDYFSNKIKKSTPDNVQSVHSSKLEIKDCHKSQVPQQHNISERTVFNEVPNLGYNLNRSEMRKCAIFKKESKTNSFKLNLEICEKSEKHLTYEVPTQIIKPQCEHLCKKIENQTNPDTSLNTCDCIHIRSKHGQYQQSMKNNPIRLPTSWISLPNEYTADIICDCPKQQESNKMPVTNKQQTEKETGISLSRLSNHEMEQYPDCLNPPCFIDDVKQYSQSITQKSTNRLSNQGIDQYEECPDPPCFFNEDRQYNHGKKSQKSITRFSNQEIECLDPTCFLDEEKQRKQTKTSKINQDEDSNKNKQSTKGTKTQNKISQEDESKKKKQSKKSQNIIKQSDDINKIKQYEYKVDKSHMQIHLEKSNTCDAVKEVENDSMQTISPTEIFCTSQVCVPKSEKSCPNYVNMQCTCCLDADLLESIRCKCKDGKKTANENENKQKKFCEFMKTCPGPPCTKQTADKCSSLIKLDYVQEVADSMAKIDCGTQDTDYCKEDFGQNYNCTIRIYVDEKLKENLNCNDLELVVKSRESKYTADDHLLTLYQQTDACISSQMEKLGLCKRTHQDNIDQESPPNAFPEFETSDQPLFNQSLSPCYSPCNVFSSVNKPPCPSEGHMSDDCYDDDDEDGDHFPETSDGDNICTQIANKGYPGRSTVQQNQKSDYNLSPRSTNNIVNNRSCTPKQEICDDSSDEFDQDSVGSICPRKVKEGCGLVKLLEPRPSASDILTIYHKRKYENDRLKRTISFKNKVHSCTQKRTTHRKAGDVCNPQSVPQYSVPWCEGPLFKAPSCNGPTRNIIPQHHKYYEERNSSWDPINTIYCNVVPTSSVMSTNTDGKLSNKHKDNILLDDSEMEIGKSNIYKACEKEIIQNKHKKKPKKKNNRQIAGTGLKINESKDLKGASERNFGVDIWNGSKKLFERYTPKNIMSKYIPEKYRPAVIISKYRKRHDDIMSKYSDDVCVSNSSSKGKNYKKVLDDTTIDLEGINLSMDAISRSWSSRYGCVGNTEDEERIVKVHRLKEATDSDKAEAKMSKGSFAVWITSSHSKRSTYPPSRSRRDANDKSNMAEVCKPDVRMSGQRRPKRRCDRKRAKRDTTDTEKELDSGDSSHILLKHGLNSRDHRSGKHKKKSYLSRQSPDAPLCSSSWPRSSECPCRGQGACAASHSTAEERSIGMSSTLYDYTSAMSRSSRSKQAGLNFRAASDKFVKDFSWHRSQNSDRLTSRCPSQTACFVEEDSWNSRPKSTWSVRDGSTNVRSTARNTLCKSSARNSSKKSIRSDSRGEHISKSSRTSNLKKEISQNHGNQDQPFGESVPRQWPSSKYDDFTTKSKGIEGSKKSSANLMSSQIKNFFKKSPKRHKKTPNQIPQVAPVQPEKDCEDIKERPKTKNLRKGHRDGESDNVNRAKRETSKDAFGHDGVAVLCVCDDANLLCELKSAILCNPSSKSIKAKHKTYKKERKKAK